MNRSDPIIISTLLLSLIAVLILSTIFCARAEAMDRIILIGDSTSAGNGSIAHQNMMVGSLLGAKSGMYVNDLSQSGAMICRHDGFPLSAIDSGINDKRSAISNIYSKYVIVFMGVNDIGVGKSNVEIKAELKAFLIFAINQGRIPVLISPLSVQNEAVDMPTLASLRCAMQSLATALGIAYIDGTTLLDVNDRSKWDDGIHPNESGNDTMTTNLAADLVGL